MGYIQAMGAYDIEGARKYATEETQKTTLDFVENTILKNMSEEGKENIKKNTPAEFSNVQVEIFDDTSANVSFHKKTPLAEADASVEMRKRDGKWLAYQPIRVPGQMNSNGSINLAKRNVKGLRVVEGKSIPRPSIPQQESDR